MKFVFQIPIQQGDTMIIFYWILCFATTVCGMETDDTGPFFYLKKDHEYYIAKYKNNEYLLRNEYIDDQSNLFSCLEKDGTFYSIHFECNNFLAIQMALQALTFENHSKILEYFFKIDNDHFYDMCNLYDIVTPVQTFKSYFSSIMILKECLQHPDLLNIKAYILTLDESKLFTSHYREQKNDRTNRLNTINSIEKDKRTPEIIQECAELTQLKNKDTTLVHLISEYIANTFLDKKRQQIENLQQTVLNDMIENRMYEADLLTIKKYIKKKNIEKQLTYREALNIGRNDEDEEDKELINAVLKLKDIDLDYWCNQVIPICCLEKNLPQIELNQSKIFNEEVFTFFLEKLAFFKNGMLDCSYMPIVDVIENKCLSHISSMLEIDLSKVKKIKIFCNFSRKSNVQDIISSFGDIRVSLPDLEEIYFTDGILVYFFSKKYFDRFLRILFYPEVDNDPTFPADKKPVKIYINKNIYEDNLKESKNLIGDMNKNVKIRSYGRMLRNIYEASHLTVLVIMVWHLCWCKKDINFFLKSFLLVMHLYLNRYNKFASLSYRIVEFSPIVLLLAIYGQWSHFPNIFKMPYSTSFLVGSLTLSSLFFSMDNMFNFYRDSSRILDDDEIKAIVEHGQYIFSYDPAEIG
ncbi:MAG TPA: hypothetical protein VL201_02720 [Patescibacteria group bacterium]|jgi:hypothetical protein|nr:hypothetical protein [Patescibacteria group bacterium]